MAIKKLPVLPVEWKHDLNISLTCYPESDILDVGKINRFI